MLLAFKYNGVVFHFSETGNATARTVPDQTALKVLEKVTVNGKTNCAVLDGVRAMRWELAQLRHELGRPFLTLAWTPMNNHKNSIGSDTHKYYNIIWS